MSASLPMVDARLTQQNGLHPMRKMSRRESLVGWKAAYVLLFNGSEREMRAYIPWMGIDT